jgi:hypothetical protein
MDERSDKGECNMNKSAQIHRLENTLQAIDFSLVWWLEQGDKEDQSYKVLKRAFVSIYKEKERLEKS